MILNFYTDTERMVEVPWALTILDSLRPEKLLDTGSVGAPYLNDIMARSEDVTLLDARPIENAPEGAHAWRGNVAEMPAAWKGRFDAVLSISMLDHVGLDSYGLSANRSDINAAPKELLRVLKDGGSLLLTVPFGKSWIGTHGNSGGQRVFSFKELQSLFPETQWQWGVPVFWKLVKGRYAPATMEEVEDADYAGHRAGAVVAVRLVKKGPDTEEK